MSEHNEQEELTPQELAEWKEASGWVLMFLAFVVAIVLVGIGGAVGHHSPNMNGWQYAGVAVILIGGPIGAVIAKPASYRTSGNKRPKQ